MNIRTDPILQPYVSRNNRLRSRNIVESPNDTTQTVQTATSQVNVNNSQPETPNLSQPTDQENEDNQIDSTSMQE